MRPGVNRLWMWKRDPTEIKQRTIIIEAWPKMVALRQAEGITQPGDWYIDDRQQAEWLVSALGDAFPGVIKGAMRTAEEG
jgi:hypothetical protein